MNKGLEATKRLRENLKVINSDEESQNFILLSIIEKELKTLVDIEDDLGIDLLTLVRAVKQQKVWVKYENKIDCCDECEYVLLDDFIYFYWNNGEHKVCSTKDYGKIWALTKDELNK